MNLQHMKGIYKRIFTLLIKIPSRRRHTVPQNGASLSLDSIRIVSLTPPTLKNPGIRTVLRPATAETIGPAISLSFGFKKGEQEAYADSVGYDELSFQRDGSKSLPICSCARTNLLKVVIATVPNVPVFTSNTDCDLGETELMIYAWKGEKLLGRWYAGRY